MKKISLKNSILAFCTFVVMGIVSVIPVFAQSDDDTRFPQYTITSLLTEQSEREEVIMSYDSVIRVQEDASLDVTENITVNARNEKIDHGIYRDFPTVYKSDYGFMARVSFDVIEVTRDGTPENYWTETLKNGTRVFIGDKEKSVSRGIHTYSIRYKTNKQVGNFEESDELYYNITGNGWDFPIRKATAQIILPKVYAENELKVLGYTGAQGADGKHYETSIERRANETVINFTTTRGLDSREGLTAVVQWPKGLITFPDDYNGFKRIFKDNLGAMFALPFAILIFIFYYRIWSKYGRDPERQAIVPTFYPPEDISPAATRYITTESVDDKALVSSLVNLSVAGYIRIEEIEEKKLIFSSKSYKLTKLKETLPESEEEKLIMEALFPGTETVHLLGKEYNAPFATMKKDFIANLVERFKESHFIDNTKYIFYGVLLSILALLLVLAMNHVATLSRFFANFPSYMVVCVLAGIGFVIFRVSFDLKSVTRYVVRGISGLWAVLVIIVANSISDDFSLPVIAAIVLLMFTNGIFSYLLKARTKDGAALYYKLEGFKMYLSTAESDDLILMNKEIPDTFEIYQKYLPFALAFDVETKWTSRFEKVIEQAKLEGTYDASPLAASGLNSLASTAGASSFTNTLSSYVSSASTVPGSSSGGSGGSSGGGGGGGGGGGW